MNDDDFGEDWDEARFVAEDLTAAMRRRICGWPSYVRNADGSPRDGYDHGHTDCWLMGLAADEIDRLRAETSRLHKMAYLTIRKPKWWPR